MRKGIVALMGVLVVGLATGWSPGQTPEDDARALAVQRRRAAELEATPEALAKARDARAEKLATGGKTELDRFVAHSVPQARAVGVGSILAAKVSPPLVGRLGVAEDAVVVLPMQDLEIRVGVMLSGPRPKGENVSLRVLRPRDPLERKLKIGDKVICAWGKMPNLGIAAVHWSKQAEEAVLFALAPGWERGKCFRCPWCCGKEWTEGKGKCSLCGEATGSGEFKLCAKCAAAAGRCQMCERTVGPATRGVTLGLTSLDPRAKTIVAPAPLTEAGFELGERIRLWVSASVKRDVAVAELPCPGGEELSGCETLYFIVDPPGRREAAVLFPILPLAGERAELQPKPLTSSNGADRIFAARMVLDDKKKVFERPGSYTVRAVAGRLVSRPVTVVVKEHKPVVPPPLPPAPRPAWLENVVPQITPDGQGVQALRDGKILWKVALRDGVGTIEQKDGLLTVTSADGRTVIALDLATGKMISKKVAR